MIRALQYLNLAGVLALAVLAVSQWRLNQHLNLEVNRLEAIRLDHASKLSEKEKAIAGYIRDLDELREHLTRLTGELKETEGKLKTAEHQTAQLIAERDQLKASIKEWAEAVNARDKQIQEANAHIKDLAASSNDTVLKFNELAAKYNSIVQDLNDRTRQFNELVAKYNELAKR